MREERRQHGVALIGRAAREEKMQSAAHRVDVGASVGGAWVEGLLGGHVSGRADGPSGDCQLDALGGPGHAEVDHPGPVG